MHYSGKNSFTRSGGYETREHIGTIPSVSIASPRQTLPLRNVFIMATQGSKASIGELENITMIRIRKIITTGLAAAAANGEETISIEVKASDNGVNTFHNLTNHPKESVFVERKVSGASSYINEDFSGSPYVLWMSRSPTRLNSLSFTLKDTATGSVIDYPHGLYLWAEVDTLDWQ